MQDIFRRIYNDAKKKIEKLKNRLEEIQTENNEKCKEKAKKDIHIWEQIAEDERKRLENEKQRKKLMDEEKEIQESFSNKVGTDIANSKKLIGFIKRYVLIGIVTGVPGIGLTYLYDKWQENKMIKDLYNKNIETVTNQNNKELAREYELLRKKFCKAYDVDKIEKLIMASDEIERLKNDKKALEKLNEEIKKCRESYQKNLDSYIENQIIEEIVEETTTIEETEEEEDEPEIRK